jgi:hypothetical protein
VDEIDFQFSNFNFQCGITPRRQESIHHQVTKTQRRRIDAIDTINRIVNRQREEGSPPQAGLRFAPKAGGRRNMLSTDYTDFTDKEKF